MTVEITEFFARAGGTSQGAAVVPGLRQVFAANHLRLAMAPHAANFSDVAHDVADLSLVMPRRYRRTDVLWASPECTWQTCASGRPCGDDPQPGADEQRKLQIGNAFTPLRLGVPRRRRRAHFGCE